MQRFSFSYFDTKRRHNLAKDFKTMAAVKLGIALLLSSVSPFLSIWVGAAGLMSAGLAGGMRLPDFISRHNFRIVKNAGLRAKVFRRTHVRNHARAYRSAPRPAFAGASRGDDSGGGSESDSGPSDSDPPGFIFSLLVIPFQSIYRKSNSFQFLCRVLSGFGCWRLFCHINTAKVVLI